MQHGELQNKRFRIPLRSSLIFRALVSIFLTLSLSLGVAGYLDIQHRKNISIKETEASTKQLSRLLAEALGYSLWNFDSEQANALLSALGENNRLCGVRVTTARGRVFVDTGFPKTLSKDQRSFAQDALFENPTLSPPVKEVIGKVELCYDQAEIEQLAAEAAARSAIFLGIVAFLLIVMGYFSFSILIDPIKKLRDAIGKIDNNKLQKITEPDLLKQNEVGLVARRFNAMVSSMDNIHQQLEKARAEAEKSDMAKSEFLANMTHELRTPLNSIIGMAEILQQHHSFNEEQDVMIHVIVESSKILLEIVNDILDISKIEAGEIKLEKISFDFQSSIRGVLTPLEFQAKKKQLSLELNCPRALPFLIGDPLRVGQILSNLVSNAIKYTEKGSVSVLITYEEMDAQHLELTCKVIDTGIGIPKQKLNQMFKKFFQVDASNTRRFGGTGLGLAITRDLVTMMFGEVGVESELGQGSTFWFTIPFETSDKLREESSSYTVKRLQKKCGIIPPEQIQILVAEDHPLNQQFIKLLLPKFGLVNYDLCENGKQVLEALAKKKYDLVLMDCFMPELNGYETTKRIRIQEKKAGAERLPIIAMTANAMAGEEQKCLAAGMDSYIPKPIIQADFVYTLSEWVRFPDDVLSALEIDKKRDKLEGEEGSPINLRTIREFSGGSTETEKALIESFIRRSDETLQKISAAYEAKDHKAWIEAAHLFKGSAGWAGAEVLRRLCDEAQQMKAYSEEQGAFMLGQIREKYQQVRYILEQHLKTL